ncbi:hypothetical protein PHMEG_00021788 [Phytophthora megakarya]|uniref:Uncharacterized protein n=1 Tax=Phytophthora megakarya TaxID=4795 RepID=A0A225VKZ6_9STRA|nr:hypothetical protein PHMEG_00021788 [Phytophthora megakarya]
METTDTISNAIANGDLETRTFSSLQAHFGQMQNSIGKYVGCFVDRIFIEILLQEAFVASFKVSRFVLCFSWARSTALYLDGLDRERWKQKLHSHNVVVVVV